MVLVRGRKEREFQKKINTAELLVPHGLVDVLRWGIIGDLAVFIDGGVRPDPDLIELRNRIGDCSVVGLALLFGVWRFRGFERSVW